MKGLVCSIHNERGVAAIQTAPGEFSVLDLFDNDPLELGDAVQ